MVKIKINIALITNPEEPKKLNMFTMITEEKLKKIMGSLEDLHAEIKNKNKERSIMIRFDGIAHDKKFKNLLVAKTLKKLKTH